MSEPGSNETLWEWDGPAGPTGAASLTGTARLRECRPRHDPLLAADSWLVDNGRVVGLDAHRVRFEAACRSVLADAGAASTGLRDFWTATIDILPRQGTWFPRVELVRTNSATPQLRLRLRPAPPRTNDVRCWIPALPDIRHFPRRKGPDIDRLDVLRKQATATAEAPEALLLSPSGLLLEATASSLLWWEGNTLCTPSPALRVLPGTTSDLILARATALNIPIRRRRARLIDLAGREAWLTNALHGIRPVSAWAGVDLPVGEARRVSAWREWWAGEGELLG